MDGWLRPGREASLREMLDDPIMHLVMARDGVSRQEVEDLVRTLCARLMLADEPENAPLEKPLAAA